MNILEKFKPIKTFVFDIDGVLTDGNVVLVGDGLQARTMNVKDGLALQMAIKNGYAVIVISGAVSEPVKSRFAYLGIQNVFLGIKNKAQFLDTFFQQQSLDWKFTLVMGDDLPDIALLQKAGLASCPSDAVQEVKEKCTYISPYGGGKGCVRDVIEKVLKLNDHWIFDTEITSK